jgi:c-di-GMP-binding flagellar brake protein YcgR
MPRKKKPSNKIPVEKRQYLRLGYSRLISFTHYDTDSLVEIPGKMAAVHDLSESGVLIESAVAFEPGNVIDLDIAFEQDKIILAQGEVVHCKKTKKGLYRTGIKFLRIEGGHLAYLKKFLNNQIEQTNIPKKKKKKK